MDAGRRWLTPIGFAVVGLVVIANAGGRVGFGLAGPSLVVTVGVAVYAVSAVVFLLAFDAPRWLTVLLLVLMAVSAALTHHGDPTGTGGIGLYLGMAFAPLRLPLRAAALVSVLGVLVFDLQLALEAPNAAIFILVVDGGAAFFFLLGVLLRTEHDQRSRADRLVVELERSREAERASAALAERARLSREMHDVLAHTLSGLVLQLDGARMLARSEGSDDRLLPVLDRARELARSGLAEARQAVAALHDAPVPGPESIPALLDEHEASTGSECTLVVEGSPAPLSTEARLALYRAVQEGLTNVRKHAPDSTVEVRLRWSAGEATIAVEDHRAGATRDAALASSGSGLGLGGLRERAESIGGRFSAGPTGNGFRLELTVPRAPVRA